MRVWLFSVVLLVAGSQASPLTSQLATDILNKIKAAGQQLTSALLQDLMTDVASILSRPSGTADKRQLDPSLQGVMDPNGVIYQHADELKQYMQTALSTAHRMDNHETYEQNIKDIMDLIDQVVASHQVSGTPVAPSTTTPAFK